MPVVSVVRIGFEGMDHKVLYKIGQAHWASLVLPVLLHLDRLRSIYRSDRRFRLVYALEVTNLLEGFE